MAFFPNWRVVGCLIALLPLNYGCAPSNAREIRELRPTTIGLVGGAFRLDGEQTVGANLDLTSNFQVDRFADEKDEDRDLTVSQAIAVSAFYLKHPMDDSAFFFGGSLEWRDTAYEFDARTTDYTVANKRRTPVEFEQATTWLGVPIGWYWIWESGFTLMLDFGPRFRLSSKTTTTKDGEDKAVDQDRRDDEIDDITKAKFRFGGIGVIGYSF